MPARQDRDIWPDNFKEVAAWLVFISVILSMGILWYTDPYFIHQNRIGGSNSVADPGSTTPEVGGDDVLYLAADDAAFMNRIFEERNNEIGYCGFLNGQTIKPHLADTISSSQDSLSFSTANCPGSGNPRATLHTHPSGNLGLSFQDKTTFASKGYRYMCIQAGEISTGPGTKAEAVACYDRTRIGGETRFVRVPVVVK